MNTDYNGLIAGVVVVVLFYLMWTTIDAGIHSDQRQVCIENKNWVAGYYPRNGYKVCYWEGGGDAP